MGILTRQFNGELVQQLTRLERETSVAVTVWGSIHNDPTKDDVITLCAVSLPAESGK